MEWRRFLLADGCPDAGEPLPHCLGDWTGEHDMAEARLVGAWSDGTVDPRSPACEC